MAQDSPLRRRCVARLLLRGQNGPRLKERRLVVSAPRPPPAAPVVAEAAPPVSWRVRGRSSLPFGHRRRHSRAGRTATTGSLAPVVGPLSQPANGSRRRGRTAQKCRGRRCVRRTADGRGTLAPVAHGTNARSGGHIRNGMCPQPHGGPQARKPASGVRDHRSSELGAAAPPEQRRGQASPAQQGLPPGSRRGGGGGRCRWLASGAGRAEFTSQGSVFRSAVSQRDSPAAGAAARTLGRFLMSESQPSAGRA